MSTRSQEPSSKLSHEKSHNQHMIHIFCNFSLRATAIRNLQSSSSICSGRMPSSTDLSTIVCKTCSECWNDDEVECRNNESTAIIRIRCYAGTTTRRAAP